MTSAALPRAGGNETVVVRAGDRCTPMEKLIVGLLFLYWLTYEHLAFFSAADLGGLAFLAITNLIKLGLPFLLLAYAGVPPRRTFARGAPAFYLICFATFLLWAAVPTIVSGDPITWVKLLPRFVYFVAALSLFTRRPATFVLFGKVMIVYVLSALVQYILLYLTGAYTSPIEWPNSRMAGPYASLGNITSMAYFPGIPVPVLRLTGYWNEPSHASACAFAGFFLGRYFVNIGESRIWRYASTTCLIAGILALSNAGYLALGSALVVGVFLDSGKLIGWRAIRTALVLPIGIGAIALVLLGRKYVAENLPDNGFARAITGVRSVEGSSADPTDGRLDLILSASRDVGKTVIGVGVQPVGDKGIQASASAPVYWLLFTGIPGILLLLAREGIVLFHGRKIARRDPIARPLVQAFVVVLAQHASYGDWMNANYFILAAAVLSYGLPSASSATEQTVRTAPDAHPV